MQATKKLRDLIKEIPPRLNKLPLSQVELKPSPSTWSPKEELGHLLDSAANNHQRIVRTQLEDKPKMPGYDGDAILALWNEHQAGTANHSWALWRWISLSEWLGIFDAGWWRAGTLGQPLAA